MSDVIKAQPVTSLSVTGRSMLEIFMALSPVPGQTLKIIVTIVTNKKIWRCKTKINGSNI